MIFVTGAPVDLVDKIVAAAEAPSAGRPPS